MKDFLAKEINMSDKRPTGYLIVKVSTASGAIPVEGATVVLQGKEENNSDILISLLTDRDGLSRRVELPAPPKELSNAPNPKQKPFSTYNIEVYKEGYYPQHYSEAPIFEGITAVQNAFVIPLSELDSWAPYYNQGQVFDEKANTLYKEE